MTRTDTFLSEVRDILCHDILSFWARMKDPRGGFYGLSDVSGKIDYGADRNVILNADIIRTFSGAYREEGEMPYLIAASHATDYFISNFIDHKYGGVYWSVNSNGERLDTDARLFAQASAICALSDFYYATKDEEAFKNAVNIFRIIEKEFRDEQYGGYTEVLTRDFKPVPAAVESDATKTAGSHLRLLCAYSKLFRIWPDETLRRRISDILDILTEKMTGDDGHIILFFDDRWSILPGGCSYGMELEASWTALDSAFAAGDIDLVNRIRPFARRWAASGLEGYQNDGSVLSGKLSDGEYDTSRQDWAVAESVIANLWLWKYHSDAEAADRAMHSWDYMTQLVKGPGVLKTPLRSTRMCLQVLRLFK